MIELRRESVDVLRAFLLGELGLDQTYEWLVEAEYDMTLSDSERDALASLRLVALEAMEGTRIPEELHTSVLALLGAAVGSDLQYGVKVTVKPYLRTGWLLYAWDHGGVDVADAKAAFSAPPSSVVPLSYSVKGAASTPAGGVLEYVS